MKYLLKQLLVTSKVAVFGLCLLRHQLKRKVQAQLGPGVQEMGGFWPSAAVALANSAATGCGRVLAEKPVATLADEGDNARVWQA